MKIDTDRNNSSALRRRKKPGGFGPLPADEPRSSSKRKKPVKRNRRKTQIYVAVSSDVQNRRFKAFHGMIASGLCVSLRNLAKTLNR